MKEKKIDCLLIGHNEMNFVEYEKTLKNMGLQSGAYRDLSLNFVTYNDRPYAVSDMFNLLSRDGIYQSPENPTLSLGQCFSATIAYLGTWLHRRKYTFDYINSFQDQSAELAGKLQQENILTIAIITTLYVTSLPIVEIVEFIKKHNRTAKIIVGGPFVSTQVRTQNADALDYLFNTIDADYFVDSSQGELALVNIIEALKKEIPISEINNIHYRENGGDAWTALPILKEDNKLNQNMVDWQLFATGAGEYTTVRTAISCPFSCSFCGYPQHAGKYQTAGVQAIEKELQGLNKIDRVKDVHFIDDTFNIPVERFKEILRMIIRNKFKFKWHSYFRCQYADEEMVSLMKESGCEGVFLGIESGSKTILDNMNKKSNVEDYQRGISLLKKYGVTTFGNFIIGFPGETDETVQETINFIKQGELDFFRAQLWYCEPITPIWQQKERYEIKGDSFQWKHKTMGFNKSCDIIEEIFLTVDNPVWVPQYNFDFDGIWHLVHRGMGIPEVKTFLREFNNGIREKLQNPSQTEISYQAVSRLKSACTGITTPAEETGIANETNLHEDAEFAF